MKNLIMENPSSTTTVNTPRTAECRRCNRRFEFAKRRPGYCPECRHAQMLEYHRGYRERWYALGEDEEGSFGRGSALWALSIRTQDEVARILGCSAQNVQRCERRILRKLRMALLDDPEILKEIAPDIAEKHLSPGALDIATRKSSQRRRTVLGGRLLSADQQEEYDYYTQLADAYERDGQHEIAAEIWAELRQLEVRLSRMSSND